MTLATRRAAALVAMLAAVAGGAAAGAEPAKSQTAPRSAERVRIPLPAFDGSLTPFTFERAYPLMMLVYDSLLWRDEAGEPQPWLARRVTRSEDGRTITAELTEGARWHDGVPVTAEDVAFSLRLFRDAAHPRFTPQLTALREVRAEGEGRVVIELDSSFLGFIEGAMADVPIVPAHLWRDLPSDSRRPPGPAIGSGPYRVEEAGPQRGYRLVANRDYFLGPPAVQEVRVPLIPTADETLDALREREVDMLPVTLPPGLLEEVEGLGIATARGPLYTGTALVLNTRVPPFDDQRVRQVVRDAIDLTRVSRAIEGVEPADAGYLHPESEFAPEPLPAAEAAAGALAGIGEVAVLAQASDPVRLEAGRQVALALTRAGAQARLKPLPPDQLEAALGVDGGEPAFAAAIHAIPALASYDPDFLSAIFGSDPATSTSPLNYSGFSDPAFDSLAARVRGERDPDRRRELVGEELRLIAGAAPAVPLFFPDGALPYRPAIYDGWTFVTGTGIFDKRSFLPGPAQDAGGELDLGIADGGDSGLPGPLGPAGLASLALFAAAAALLALGLRRKRRGRDSR